MNAGRWLCSGLLAASLGARADDATQKVLNCMRANIPPSLQIKEVELASVDRSGAERLLKGKVYVSRDNGLIRVLLRISKPNDLDGAAYLMREGGASKKDDIFLYLPALQRVRKISGGSADAPLLGTDFSYNDMKQLQAAFGDSQTSLDKPTILEQRPVHVLQLQPPAGSGARYSRVRTYVDQKTCVALKAEFFEGNVLRKELSAPADSLKRADGYWYLSDLTMRDVKENTSTRLKVVGVVGSEQELPSRLFDPTSFYRGN
ncbi:outer membrane lipoprotein-sorting protein [Nevskia ramosa]|uniref:outer membrane lipoprotein-sorting protein n=1 Tax=Nevskia ramosa TaxID=64002 RepID=UPI0003B39AA8|nr:outer membrane lipoprotein-sorting protein [Nevskia ramosa]